MILGTPRVLVPLTLGLVITLAPGARADCPITVDKVKTVLSTDPSTNPISLDCGTLFALPGRFAVEEGIVFDGFGVAGGFVPGEIDSSPFESESITIIYDAKDGEVVRRITLAFLYPMAGGADDVDETAFVTVNNDRCQTYSLKATNVCGSTCAVWTHEHQFACPVSSEVPMIVPNVSVPDGVYAVLNPFPDATRVHTLKFTAKPAVSETPPRPPSAATSDFAINRVDTSVVELCPFPSRDIFGTSSTCGSDLGGTGVLTTLSFIGSAGSSGRTWLTVFDETPGTPDQTIVTGSVSLSADVLIHRFNNKKGVGLLALFNEGTGQKGLVLILYDAGNTDSLLLATVDQAGKLTALRSVALGAGILLDQWYHLTMDVVVSGDDLTVAGRAFRHTAPNDPNSPVWTQVGGTLSTPNPLSLTALGLQASGQIGIVASAISAVVDSSVTNFAVSQD